MDNLHLPSAEKNQLKIGYMRLSDSAPLIFAKEEGFFEELELDVELVQEVSWANLRDRLLLGDLDAAQLLSPLPMMTTLGAGGMRGNLITGLALCLNGNAITLSTRYASDVKEPESSVPPDPLLASQRLKALLDSKPKPGMTFATVHLFSMHTVLLRMWLRAGGIDPDRDVRIIVLPPSQMSDSLARGIIDGYCVGEPWNTVAVHHGTGFVVCTGYDIWNNAPEKVLGVTEQWHQHHSCTHLRLRIALIKACQKLVDPSSLQKLPALLSKPEYLNLPESILSPSLTGQFKFSKQEAAISIPDFHVFWRYQAGFPWRSASEKLVRECAFAFTHNIDENQIRSLSQQCYRTDLYREACRYLNIPSPSRDSKVEGTHSTTWEMEPGISLGPDMFL